MTILNLLKLYDKISSTNTGTEISSLRPTEETWMALLFTLLPLLDKPSGVQALTRPLRLSKLTIQDSVTSTVLIKKITEMEFQESYMEDIKTTTMLVEILGNY